MPKSILYKAVSLLILTKVVCWLLLPLSYGLQQLLPGTEPSGFNPTVSWMITGSLKLTVVGMVVASFMLADRRANLAGRFSNHRLGPWLRGLAVTWVAWEVLQALRQYTPLCHWDGESDDLTLWLDWYLPSLQVGDLLQVLTTLLIYLLLRRFAQSGEHLRLNRWTRVYCWLVVPVAHLAIVPRLWLLTNRGTAAHSYPTYLTIMEIYYYSDQLLSLLGFVLLCIYWRLARSIRPDTPISADPFE